MHGKLKLKILCTLHFKYILKLTLHSRNRKFSKLHIVLHIITFLPLFVYSNLIHIDCVYTGTNYQVFWSNKPIYLSQELELLHIYNLYSMEQFNRKTFFFYENLRHDMCYPYQLVTLSKIYTITLSI